MWLAVAILLPTTLAFAAGALWRRGARRKLELELEVLRTEYFAVRAREQRALELLNERCLITGITKLQHFHHNRTARPDLKNNHENPIHDMP